MNGNENKIVFIINMICINVRLIQLSYSSKVVGSNVMFKKYNFSEAGVPLRHDTL